MELVRAPYSWSKDCKCKSRQERQENFLLQSQLCVVTLIRCPSHPCVTAVACKRPQSFCQKCRWLVPLNTHTPLTQWSCSGLTIPLSRHSVGTYQKMSSHASHQGTLSHSHLSSLSHCGLILTKKSWISVRELISSLKKEKKKRHSWGMNCQTFSQNPGMWGNGHHHHQWNDTVAPLF